MKLSFRTAAILLLVASGLVYLSGCNSHSASSPKTNGGAESKPDDSKKPADGVHGHSTGSHGGIIVEIGRDSYHAEAVFEKGGSLRLYILGKDESRVQEIERQDLTGFAKIEGGADSTEFVLKPAPQNGDSDGTTSLFSGQLPKEAVGKGMNVTIPSIRVGGERFRISFSSSPIPHQEASAPVGVEGDDAQKLYLTPGGKYTKADILANGNTTAAEKFKGMVSAHDSKPKVGEKTCPISLTKANPQFSWIVGGKSYQFCCPPCVDEFVQTAKEHPEQIKEPGEYVKK